MFQQHVRPWPQGARTVRSDAPVNPLPWWKRGLDIGCLLLASPLLLPLMTGIALLIRISSRGPVLFRQERIGLHETPFTCLKFRTMQVSAHTAKHEAHVDELINSGKPMEKLDDKDERLLPFGAVLRASGLDELPQVINVLRREMSLVGPRPCTRFEFEKYQPEQRERFKAAPGLTGLWQVSGKNKTTFQEMIDLDIQYAETRSLSRDVGILVRTFPVLAGQCLEAWRRKRTRRAR